MEQTNTTIPVNQTTAIPAATRKGKRWSAEEDARLLEEVTRADSFNDIATAHQRTVSAITLRIVMHATKAIQDGMSLEEAATHFHLPAERITQGLPVRPKSPPVTATTQSPVPVPANPVSPKKAKGKKWTIIENTELLSELIDGVSIPDIATAHQRTVPSIKRRCLSLARTALSNGMSLEEVSRTYRIPVDKINKRPPKQPVAQRNTTLPPPVTGDAANLAVLIEIRDLLRTLVTHMTKQ
jgi:hypothetical protein